MKKNSPWQLCFVLWLSLKKICKCLFKILFKCWNSQTLMQVFSSNETCWEKGKKCTQLFWVWAWVSLFKTPFVHFGQKFWQAQFHWQVPCLLNWGLPWEHTPTPPWQASWRTRICSQFFYWNISNSSLMVEKRAELGLS